jgi:hypothetical protein
MRSQLATLLILLSISSMSIAQDVGKSLPYKWNLISLPSDVNSGLDWRTCYSYSKGIVYPDNHSAIMPVQFNKHTFGIVRVGANGNEEWQLPLKGYVVGLSKLDKLIVVFYTDEWNEDSFSSIIKLINAALVDPSTGKIVSEKTVFENKKHCFIDPKVNSDPDGQFANVLIRYSGQKGNKRKDSQLETTDIELMTLSQTLEATSQILHSVASSGVFLGCVMVNRTDLIIASQKDAQFVAEKFTTSSPTPLETFTADTHESAEFFKPIIGYGKDQPNKVFVGVLCHIPKKYRVSRFFSIDLSAKSVNFKEDVLDKEYADHLASLPSNHGSKKFKDKLNELYPAALSIGPNQVIYTRQFNVINIGNNGSGIAFNNEELLVNAYDQQLNTPGEIMVNKFYQTFIYSGATVGQSLDGNRVRLFFNENSGIGRLTAVLAEINLENLTVTKKTWIDKQGMPGEAHIDAQGILWFGDSIILPYHFAANFATRNQDTFLQPLKF